MVIPTYRHAHHIEKTLESVFAQTFQDFEVIVVNDGSPDDTAAVLRPWVDAGRIRYHEQKNRGQSAARNEGLRQVRGEYLAFLDDDDLWPADKLAWQVAILRANPDAVAAYGYAALTGKGEDFRFPHTAGPSGKIRTHLLNGNFIVSPGQVLMRTKNLAELGGLDESIKGADDWDLWLRLAACGNFIYEDRCALNYRYHEGNASRDYEHMFHSQMQVLRKHLGSTPVGLQWRDWWRCRRYIGRGGASSELLKAEKVKETGGRLDTLRHLSRAVRYDPLLIGSKRLWGLILAK